MRELMDEIDLYFFAYYIMYFLDDTLRGGQETCILSVVYVGNMSHHNQLTHTTFCGQ